MTDGLWVVVMCAGCWMLGATGMDEDERQQNVELIVCHVLNKVVGYSNINLQVSGKTFEIAAMLVKQMPAVTKKICNVLVPAACLKLADAKKTAQRT